MTRLHSIIILQNCQSMPIIHIIFIPEIVYFYYNSFVQLLPIFQYWHCKYWQMPIFYWLDFRLLKTTLPVQTLNLGITIRTLSFSTLGQHLKTDRGVLHVSSLESFTNSSEQVRPLFVLDNWVIEEGKSILWLPPDYWATFVANWNGIVVLGHSSGCMSFPEFEEGLKTV